MYIFSPLEDETQNLPTPICINIHVHPTNWRAKHTDTHFRRSLTGRRTVQQLSAILFLF